MGSYPSDAMEEVRHVVDGDELHDEKPLSRNKEQARTRRLQALSLRLSGLNFEDIGKHLDCSAASASKLVNETLRRAENPRVEDMRELENTRLDRAQAAIWPRVLQGDLPSIDRFLRISQHRSKINGLESAKKVDLTVGVKQEMFSALDELEKMVVGEVVDAEVVRDENYDE